MEDLGPELAERTPGIPELSRISEHASERDGHRLISKKFKLALPVKVTTLNKPGAVSFSGDLDFIRLTDWFSFILEYNTFHLLCGLKSPDPHRERCILTEFWQRYRSLKPQHPMWQLVDKGKLDVSRCAPIYLHGDEGRSRKRSAFLVISYHSCLGLGTEAANLQRKKKRFLDMKLNFLGHTHTHRFLSGVLPKMTREHEALLLMLETVARDVNEMMMQGVCNAHGERFFAVCLGSTGDWAWLIKAGNLCRGYSNCIKRPLKETTRPKGLCHLCCAGQLNVPFEKLKFYRSDSTFPEWWDTMFTQSGFATPHSPLNAIGYIPQEAEGFYQYDVFHCYHLGVGRYFVASCLAIMSERMWATNAKERFEQLTQLYLTWCSEERRSPYLTTITQAKINWTRQIAVHFLLDYGRKGTSQRAWLNLSMLGVYSRPSELQQRTKF